MQARSILVTVTTAGTPARVTADETIKAFRVDFATIIGGSGRVIVGLASLDASTFANVLAEILPVASDNPSVYALGDAAGGNSIRLSDFWIDVQTSGQKCLVTYYYQ